MSHEVSIAGAAPRPVTVVRTHGSARVWLGGRELVADLTGDPAGAQTLRVGERTIPVHVHVDGDAVFVHAFGAAWELRLVDPDEQSQRGAGAADAVTAPMPGSVVEVLVAPGDPVEVGQVLVVIESMKMHSELVTSRDGVVARVLHDVGETFDRDAALVELEPADGAGEAA